MIHALIKLKKLCICKTDKKQVQQFDSAMTELLERQTHDLLSCARIPVCDGYLCSSLCCLGLAYHFYSIKSDDNGNDTYSH